MKDERFILGTSLLTVAILGLAAWLFAGMLIADPRIHALIAWALVLLTWLGVYAAIGLRLNVPLFYVGYVLYLIGAALARRAKRWWRAWRKHERQEHPRREIRTASTVFEIPGMHRLKRGEVLMGYKGRKPIKTDITKSHWLIAGSTGAGKTSALQLILCQLFMDPAFHDEVYIVDLKRNVNDALGLWRPLVTGFANTIPETVAMLDKLIAKMDRRMAEGWSTRVYFIFDEVAISTWATDAPTKKAVRHKMGILAMQSLAAGFILIAATQYPRYDMLDKMIAYNLNSKLCLVVDDRAQAEVVLGFHPPRLLTQKGEFWMRDHELGLKQGRTVLVNLPGDVQQIVTAQLVDSRDPRLDYFRRCCVHLPIDKGLAGVHRMAEALKGEGLEWGTDWQMTARRNYAQAGALTAPQKRGQYYYLARPYTEALLQVAEYVRAGRWQEAPEAFVDVEA